VASESPRADQGDGVNVKFMSCPSLPSLVSSTVVAAVPLSSRLQYPCNPVVDGSIVCR
jgi:hypothetical protein